MSQTAVFPVLLVVDDDRDIRNLLSEHLEQHGFRTVKAADGRAMRAALEAGPVDLVVLDLNLPDEDGLSLCRAIRATSRTPVIMLTARGDPIDRIVGLEMGADDYMAKPFEPRELVARIRYHSRSYMTLLQRDAAYRALRVSQQQLLDTNLVLQRLMNSDGLTGLSNRRHFDEYLELEWRRSLRDQSQLSLLMIDVDYFKSYNDNFGHLEGDEALRKVATAIRDASARPSDLPARYGGEEFALVLPNTSPGGARLVAEKLRQTVAALKIPHISPTEGSSLTISIGLSTMTPQPGADCRQLISAADKGLYLAKNNGRNQVGIE